MMLKSRFRRLALMAVVASIGAIGYSYAGGDSAGKRAAEIETAKGGCPFAAIRAALWGTHRASQEAVSTDSALLAAEEAFTAAEGDCPDGSCPVGAARAGSIGLMTRADVARQVTKTADGVLIRLSSKKPGVVKMIQSRFEPMFARDAPAVVPVNASSNEIAR
jgi:hypothetical protein